MTKVFIDSPKLLSFICSEMKKQIYRDEEIFKNYHHYRELFNQNKKVNYQIAVQHLEKCIEWRKKIPIELNRLKRSYISLIYHRYQDMFIYCVENKDYNKALQALENCILWRQKIVEKDDEHVAFLQSLKIEKESLINYILTKEKNKPYRIKIVV